MPSFVDPIVAVSLTANGRTGLTLFAPPWEDADGEEWQGFLGDGAKIVLLGTADELNTWLGDHPDHDLADHPAWQAFVNQGKQALTAGRRGALRLRRGSTSWPPPSRTPRRSPKLADTVDMAARIADCCEDGMLRSLLNGTREYALLVEGETGYSGKDGSAEWSALGDVIAEQLGAGAGPDRVLAALGGLQRRSRSAPTTCRRRR